MRLHYAATARAGLDVPFTATVRHEGGLGKEVTLAVTADYLDIFETQGFTPEPSSTSAMADTLYLTFDAPPGRHLHRCPTTPTSSRRPSSVGPPRSPWSPGTPRSPSSTSSTHLLP